MKYAEYIDIPNWETLQSQLITFRKENTPESLWWSHPEEEVKKLLPNLYSTFKDMGLTMRQLIFFDNLNNDLTVTDETNPKSLFIHTDSKDSSDSAGTPQIDDVEFSTEFNPSFAINIPLEHYKDSLTLWYKFIKETDQDTYYPGYDCGGHAHSAVEEVFRFELMKPAVIRINKPHAVYNPNIEPRSVATFRFYEDLGSVFKL